jgi:uncharacterized membrane protein HdeD (DUF308 family)
MWEQMARHWYTLAARGVLAILFGILAFLAPSVFVATFALLIGVYFLMDGILALVAAVRFGHRDNRWWALLLEGALGLLAGILTFRNPLATAVGLVYLIGAWALITGVMEIVAAVQLRRVIHGEFWLIVAGVVSVALGLALFAHPGTGILAGAFLIGAYALVFGVALVALAFRLRRGGAGSAPGGSSLTV